MNLEEYISKKYKDSPMWFVQELSSYENQSRITDTYAIKEYLDGQHNILNRPNYKYNGQVVEPRKIVIQMAKTILNFKTQYLLKNPVQFVGQKRMVEKFLKINKVGRFDDKNEKILNRMLKFGQVAEYVFINNKGDIDSKLINADEGTPVFNHYGEMIGFIEHYTYDGVTYYVVYTENHVQEWNDEGTELHMTGSYPNLSGLPVLYKTEDEFSNTVGRSELKDYTGILDNMEDVLSKYVDSMYKFMNPIPVVVGQQLKDSLPQDVVGGGINLDDGSDFKMVSNELDSASFELVFKTLTQTLLDVSSTPAVSMNKTDISNLSEVSIKLLFSLADTSAGTTENFLINGFYERWERIVRLLSFKGEKISENAFSTLDFKFHYNTPANHKEVIENMKTQWDMGAISIETILEQSPYTSDVANELLRLKNEEGKQEVNEKVDNETDNTDVKESDIDSKN